MTDYIKITDFAAKDTLATGSPEKKVRGTEIDAEFTAIAASLETKIDDEQKNLASGVAGLSSAGLLSTGVIPSWAAIQSVLGLAEDGLAVADTTLQAGLNADLLDGQEGSYYLDAANHTNTTAAVETVTSLTSDIVVDTTDTTNPTLDLSSNVKLLDTKQTLTTPNQSTWLSATATGGTLVLDLEASHLFRILHGTTGNVGVTITNGSTCVGQTVIIEFINGSVDGDAFTLGAGFDIGANRTGADTLTDLALEHNLVSGIVGTLGTVLL